MTAWCHGMHACTPGVGVRVFVAVLQTVGVGCPALRRPPLAKLSSFHKNRSSDMELLINL